MKHAPTSVRFDEPTRKQLEALAAQRGTNRNEVIKTAIDRMFKEDLRNMATCEICGRTFSLKDEGWMETDTGDACPDCVRDAESVEAPGENE